ncbi:hypothetical protein FQN55_002193 [Onygenales sp. PD_40]|nr:hypothetical protein FQN55_002193 [Onygenales sp. PD_40]KAK2790167.1 hypothetical protein FQN51_002498 [Onygenales sp. PD_10]
MDWLVYFLPQQWLIGLCERAKRQNAVVGGLKEGNLVLRISASVVVKRGHGVTPGEAATQRYAYERLDRHVVRVPYVYRYFQDHSDPTWPIGYLFMEYIPGLTLEEHEVDIEDISERITTAVLELSTISGPGPGPSTDIVPGPIGGGMIQGYLWGDNGTRENISSVEDMNRWLNKRLKLINKTINLHPYPLVLCHLDLCRRNIKVTEDNSICLLDWGHAGFFPRFFETAALSCINDDWKYRDSLCGALKRAKELTDAEQECVGLLLRARAGSLRYIFEPQPGTGMPDDLDSLGPLPPLKSLK